MREDKDKDLQVQSLQGQGVKTGQNKTEGCNPPTKLCDLESEVAQSCPTLCDPVDCSLSGFSVHGILQARIPEWVTISFSRGSSRPRD